ncbi:MAG: outer membrane beta-barrel protein [Kofleriaceae bacterium]
MTRALLTLAILVGTSSIAVAGPFVGLGIGTSPATGGGIDFTQDGRSLRLFGGYQFPYRITAEALVTRYGLVQEGGRIYDGTQLGLAGRYNHPIAEGFEAFGRLGMQHTSMTSTASNDSGADASGKGVLLGVGIEYKIKIKFLASASVYFDYTIAAADLEGPSWGNVATMSTRHWTMGATVGF